MNGRRKSSGKTNGVLKDQEDKVRLFRGTVTATLESNLSVVPGK